MLNNKEPERYEQPANPKLLSASHHAPRAESDAAERRHLPQNADRPHLQFQSHRGQPIEPRTNAVYLRDQHHRLTEDAVTDTCLTAQDQYKASLNYFRIKYD